MKNIPRIVLLLIAFVLAVFIIIYPAKASPSNADLTIYHDRALIYMAMKQSPEQITVSLGNYFGHVRQPDGSAYFQYRNNPDGTIDVIYIESDGNTIRFIATVVRLKPVYVEIP